MNYCNVTYEVLSQKNENMIIGEFKNGVIYAFDILAINQLLSTQIVCYSKKTTVLGIDMKARDPLNYTGECYNYIVTTLARPTQYFSRCMFEMRRLTNQENFLRPSSLAS